MGSDSRTTDDAAAGFGERLRAHRLAANLTQAELATRTGLSERGISDLERGARRRPYADTVRRLADALGLRDVGCLPEASDLDPLAGAAPNHPANPAAPAVPLLPAPPTTLVGRSGAVAGVVALLQSGAARLMTLTGPGGVGKTRLALAATAALFDAYPSGVWFVDLASAADDGIDRAVAGAIGVRTRGNEPLAALVAGFLRPRTALLLLDNLEHLADAPRFAADLLAACPDLVILATSRTRLRVRGERAVVVAPLGLPPAGVTAIAEYPAVRLFVERLATSPPASP